LTAVKQAELKTPIKIQYTMGIKEKPTLPWKSLASFSATRLLPVNSVLRGWPARESVAAAEH
jgi:hypothetical protein